MFSLRQVVKHFAEQVTVGAVSSFYCGDFPTFVPLPKGSWLDTVPHIGKPRTYGTSGLSLLDVQVGVLWVDVVAEGGL